VFALSKRPAAYARRGGGRRRARPDAVNAKRNPRLQGHAENRRRHRSAEGTGLEESEMNTATTTIEDELENGFDWCCDEGERVLMRFFGHASSRGLGRRREDK
jgi:hypothetical protein